MSITEAIKEKALELGFVGVGVAPAEGLTDDERALRERMASGGLAGLGYFTPQRAGIAAEPRALLPGARAVVALALPMDRAAVSPPPPMHGLVARYAWGRDYHKRARERLEALVAFIHEQTGAQSRAFVDATPLLERAFAARAGLGLVGKNNCLITPTHGSWVSLAEVVTQASLETEGGAPERRHGCGHCTACLEACPTGALTAPFGHKADRCLSFLTTELRGSIPRSLRPSLGARVLGCDSCQDVCPKNRQRTAGLEVEPMGGLRPWLALPDLFAADEGSFVARFAGTAATRAKRAGLLRNAAVALGNSGDRAAVPVLARALDDPEPLVRGHAAWALGVLGGPASRAALEASLARETDGEAREELAAALEGRP